MKKLDSFVFEYRTKKTEMPEKDIDLKKLQGKDAEDNGSNGLFGISEPTDDSPVEPLKKEDLNRNMKRLLMKFKTEEPFFIQGEAGWGKTSIVEDMAKRFKRIVITVYLDKACKEDLGGIPVPVKGKSGAVQELALPAWAKVMEDNPDVNFLLFFDEMNQANPDVMNALMPIVKDNIICGRKFGPKDEKGRVIKSNYFVGAAGNLREENEEGVSELSGPLESRFKPIIVWECGTPEAWKSSFNFIRKKWGKDEETNTLIDALEGAQNLFKNPREVEQKIIKHAIAMKQDEDKDLFDASDYLDRLEGLVKEDTNTRSDKARLTELADAIYAFVNDTAKKAKTRTERKDADMLPANVKQHIEDGMRNGYIEIEEGSNAKHVKYGISRENIMKVIDTDVVNAEMVKRIISKFEADGIKFKYEKDDEWRKAGYKDPDDPDEE